MAIFPKVERQCPVKDTFSNYMEGDVCRLCERQVFDLNTMSDPERKAFMASCSDEICVSYKIPLRGLAAVAALGAAAGALEQLRKQPEMGIELCYKATRLRENLRRQGWQVPPGRTPIIPLLVGSEERTLALSAALRERGHFTPAIRPPTVPPGSCRLRISVTLRHTDADYRRLERQLCDLFKEYGS